MISQKEFFLERLIVNLLIKDIFVDLTPSEVTNQHVLVNRACF